MQKLKKYVKEYEEVSSEHSILKKKHSEEAVYTWNCNTRKYARRLMDVKLIPVLADIVFGYVGSSGEEQNMNLSIAQLKKEVKMWDRNLYENVEAAMKRSNIKKYYNKTNPHSNARRQLIADDDKWLPYGVCLQKLALGRLNWNRTRTGRMTIHRLMGPVKLSLCTGSITKYKMGIDRFFYHDDPIIDDATEEIMKKVEGNGSEDGVYMGQYIDMLGLEHVISAVIHWPKMYDWILNEIVKKSTVKYTSSLSAFLFELESNLGRYDHIMEPILDKFHGLVVI